jgi:hypothetical protein
MNTYSTIHKRFSESLNNPRVLENPEEFLGPNFEAVLNFWLILDDLSEEQIKVVKERYNAFYVENRSECVKAINLARDASYDVLGWDYAYKASSAAWTVTNFSQAARWATSELIGMHKIHEDHQQPLTFFQMFLDF